MKTGIATERASGAGPWRAAIVAIGAAMLAGCGAGAPTPSATATAPTGPRLVLRQSAVTDWQAVPGEIATVDQAQVIARIPGILVALSVKEGDTVRKGQLIGRIVDSQLGPQAGAYGAQAAAAQAQAAQAQADLARVKFLYDNGVYAKARLDQARAAADTARAQIAAARAQQAAVTAVAAQGGIVAPASGRVLHADIPAGAPVAPGMVIATITAGAPVLRLSVPESLAAHLSVGSAVRARVDDREETGRIVRLYPAVQSGQAPADVTIPGLGDRLVGRRIAARVAAGTRPALLVPRAYVVSRFGIDYATVLARDGSAAAVPVQTAPAEDGKIEILSGVTVGDTLIAAAAK